MSLSPMNRFRLGMLAGLLAVLVVAAPEAHAQQVRTITFNEAVQIALDQNYLLQRAANVVEQQAITVAQERADFLPNLTFSTNAGHNRGRSFNLNAGGLINQAATGVGSDINAGVNLFNGFADVASLRQARLLHNAADLDFERQRQTVVFSVMSNYLEMIQRREQVSIQQENLTAQEQLLTQIDEFVRVGSRPISDLFQQQATTANAELMLLQAQRLYQLAEVALIQTLQLDPFGQYAFAVPPVEDLALTPETYALREMLETAFDQRLDLHAQKEDIEAAEAGIRVARASFWPTINLSARTSFDYTDARDTPFSTQYFDERNSFVGLSFNVPIFDRFQTRNNIQRARVQLKNARLDLENLQQDIALQVRQAYLDYLNDEKRLDVSEKQLRASEQALEAEQERYNVGASTLVELTQARANFVQASSDRAAATYDFLFRKKLIDYYIGVLDPTRPLFE